MNCDDALALLARAERECTTEDDWDNAFKMAMDWSDLEMQQTKQDMQRHERYPDAILLFVKSWYQSLKRGFFAEWDSSDDDDA